MKKGKNIYLIGAIIIFIIALIPYFQNAGMGFYIYFFFDYSNILIAYMWILTFGIGLGVCIILYIQSVLNDVNRTEPEKFNLE